MSVEIEKEENEIITREVGERVDIQMAIDQSTVKALGDGQFTATITTSAVDRHGETIATEGVSTDAYMQNPVVLYGHDYSALPIGKTISMKAFKNKMTATFQLATKEYAFADTVAQLIKGGYLNAVSIGGVVKEWNDTYTGINKMEMVEFSVVPVPANGEALITGKSLEVLTGKSAEQVSKEYHDFVDKSYTSKLKGLDTDELDRHIKTLKDLTAILESTKATKTSEEQSLNSEEDEKITLTLRKTAGKASQTAQNIIKLVKSKEI